MAVKTVGATQVAMDLGFAITGFVVDNYSNAFLSSYL